MKKLFALGALAGAIAAMTPVANAGTVTSTFAVSATLTSACKIGAFPVAGIDFGTVDAFVAPANKTTTATVSCTRGFAPTSMTIEAAPAAGGGTGSSGGAAPIASPALGEGVLPGNELYYQLSASLVAPAGGSAPTAGTGLAAQDADEGIVTVTGSMPAQAGKAAGGAQSHTRTLTVTY